MEVYGDYSVESQPQVAIWGSAVFVTLVSLYNPLNSPVGDINVAPSIFSIQSVVMKICDMNWNTKLCSKINNTGQFQQQGQKRESKGLKLHTSKRTSTKLQSHSRHICLLKWEVTQIRPVSSFFGLALITSSMRNPSTAATTECPSPWTQTLNHTEEQCLPKWKKAAREVWW